MAFGVCRSASGSHERGPRRIYERSIHQNYSTLGAHLSCTVHRSTCCSWTRLIGIPEDKRRLKFVLQRQPSSALTHFFRSVLSFKTPLNRSPILATRSLMLKIVKSRGDKPCFTSFHNSGVDTLAPATGRTL